MLRRLPFFLLLPAVLACSKSDSSPTIDFGKGEGITYRDHSNLPAGPGDPTDWTLDATWNEQEQALFQSLGVDVSSPAQGSAGITGAYPNPAYTGIVFGYSIPGTAAYKIVIVDASYKVITESGSVNPTSNLSIALDLTRTGFSKGQRYRLYYVLYNGSTLYYKGHGDIKMAE